MAKRFYVKKVDKLAAIRRILQKNPGHSRREALRKIRKQYGLRPSQAFVDCANDSTGLQWKEEEVPVNKSEKTGLCTRFNSKAAAVRRAIFHNRQASNKAIQKMLPATVGSVSLKYISSMRSRMETDFPGAHFSLYGKLARHKH